MSKYCQFLKTFLNMSRSQLHQQISIVIERFYQPTVYGCSKLHSAFPFQLKEMVSQGKITWQDYNMTLTGPGFKRNPDKEWPDKGRSSFSPIGGLSTTERRLQRNNNDKIINSILTIAVHYVILKSLLYSSRKYAYSPQKVLYSLNPHLLEIPF